jgi:hypothetical protein
MDRKTFSEYLHTMPKSFHLMLSLLIVSLLLTLSSCGSSESLVHIEGAPAIISKATLNHWMQAMAGGDFRANIGTRGPAGLVSEPANYTRCASAVALIAPKSFYGQVKLTDAEISQRCHQLHRAVKFQALSFLISVGWTVAEGAEEGVKVSDAELMREFARFRKGPYPTEADLRKYLRERQWSLSDVLYQLKRNILVTRILPKFKAKVNDIGGGEETYVKLALERYHRLIARTSCRAAYVVPNCREYRGSLGVTPALSPDVIFEEIVQGRKSVS